MSFWSGLTAVSFLLAGCAGGASSSAGTVKLTGAEIEILLGSGSPAQRAQVANANEELVQQCMRSQGLVYYPSLVTAADEVRVQQVPGVPGADISIAMREADGYGFYTAAVQSAQNGGAAQSFTGEERYADSLTGAAGRKYRQALDGSDNQRIMVTLPGGGNVSVPSGGCIRDAWRRLYGSVGNGVQVTTGYSLLYDQLYNAVTADAKFTAVESKWSSCMIKQGFRYKTPTDLWNNLNARIDRRPTRASRELEIKVAVADYRCETAVQLVPTVRRLEIAHAQYMTRSLAQYMAVVAQADAKAQKVAQAMQLPS